MGRVLFGAGLGLAAAGPFVDAPPATLLGAVGAGAAVLAMLLSYLHWRRAGSPRREKRPR